MMLSVVIATFNRSAVLRQNLDCFRQQTDMDFEVVVAIDGSTDDTIEMLKAYDAPFELRWVDTGDTDIYGLGRARNMGILATRGKAVVILDDDSFPVPEFVAEHKRTVKWKTLTGGCRIFHDGNKQKMERCRKGLTTLSGACENNTCMYRRDWIGSGLFSEQFRGYGGMGSEFLARLEYQGYTYQFNNAAAIYHHGEFEGDNGMTRKKKTEQATRAKVLQKRFQT